MKNRLFTTAVFGGIIAVVVLIVAIVELGRRNPSPPSLVNNPQPEIPGEVLFLNPDGCIIRARASGEQRDQLRCVGSQTSIVTWLDYDRIAWRSFVTAGAAWTVLSLSTGKTLEQGVAPDRPTSNPVSVRGERVDFAERGSVYRISDGERTRILRFIGARSRAPALVTWSPDGECLLLRSDRELWVVRRDGSVAGVLGETSRRWPENGSWRIEGAGYLPPVTLTQPNPAPTPAGR